jgi:hypothetical protein
VIELTSGSMSGDGKDVESADLERILVFIVCTDMIEEARE